jgi:glycosyltransferase involved in cell wall biosynthesis
MKRPVKILHLVDDTTAGGVMRVVDFILSHKGSDVNVFHESLSINRGEVKATRYEADIIVSHLTISWRSIPALLGLRLANFGKKLIHVEHSYTEGFVACNVKSKGRFINLLRYGFSIFNEIIAVSYAQEKWFNDQALCTRRKVRTIQSCVNLGPFRDISDRKKTTRIFAAIGRLDMQKGFDDLITAFKACPEKDIELHVYGEGAEELKLRKLASDDPRIFFKGFASNPTEAFLNVDVVVMPSRWEAYGLVAVEALSAGCELICADIDGLRDHRELGAVILEECSTSCLTEAISKASRQSQKSLTMLRQKTEALDTQFLKKWDRLISDSIR